MRVSLPMTEEERIQWLERLPCKTAKIHAHYKVSSVERRRVALSHEESHRLKKEKQDHLRRDP